MKIQAKFILVNEFGNSIFEDYSGHKYTYCGQFRKRENGDIATISITYYGIAESVLFHK